ncbi:CubicO group peptidase, beta-lactamase class C family [Lachnospiraceae bacterium NE2001]|nr:CubicO group peptidase, beta-lactamase class C family [Lachnospiraceae bacterium NE2001]
MKNIKKMYAGIILGLSLTIPIGSVIVNAQPLSIASQNTSYNASTHADVSEDNSDYILNIGSVSKVYVTTAVMQLVDQGKVELDAPVTDYIPDFKLADERYKDITVRMLMNHTSGLMGSQYSGLFLLGEKSEEYHDAFLKNLESEQLKADPGAFNCYCNDGFTLLEIIVERVSGMTFTEYMEENICKPLSISNTGSVWNMDMDRQAPIYVNGNVKLEPEYGLAIGAGGIASTAVDVSTFGSAFFTGNNVLLSEESKKEMAENNKTGDSAENFGLGWDEVEKEDYKSAGVTVLSKGGDTDYQHASLVVAPDVEISVAVLSSDGGSGINEKMALALMDEALKEQGINIDHPEEEKPELLSEVPEEFLKYEGLYANTSLTLSISFPDKKYMRIVSVTSDKDFEEQFMYTAEDTFVKMSGDVTSGNAIVDQPVQSYSFEEKDGQIYLMDSYGGYSLYKVSEEKVDSKVQSAWDARNGVTYYLVSGPSSEISYAINNHFKLRTSEDAPGFVNGYRMQDENHAGVDYVMPGTVSRDISDLRMEEEDGKEFLCLDDYGLKCISEKNIPLFTDDVKNVELKSDEATWYKLDGAKNETLKLDIPDNASVYVYDKYMNIKYSSKMVGYGDSVPLPEYGMIVFVGETGSTVSITR